MRGRMLVVSAGFAIAGGFSVSALAGPLDRSVVPSSAGWVIHVDVEAAVGSAVGKHMLAHPEQFPRQGLNELQAFGIDPLTDIKGVTVFGSGKKSEEGVIVVDSTQAIDALWNHLKSEPSSKAMTVDGVEMLSWDDKGERKYGMVKPGKTADRRVVYIAEDWSVLSAAVNSAGKGKTDKDLPGPGAGSVIYVEGSVIPEEMKENDDPNASAVLKALKSGWLDIGEHEKNVYAKVSANFADAATAANVKQVLEGVMAFGRLAIGQNPDLADLSKMLMSVKVDAGGAGVTVGGQWAVDDAIKAITTAAKMEGIEGDDDEERGDKGKHDKDEDEKDDDEKTGKHDKDE